MSQDKQEGSTKVKRNPMLGRERSLNKKIARWLIFFLIIVAVFVTGFLFRSNTALMASLGIINDDALDAPSGTTSQMLSYDTLSARIGEVEDMLADYSFDDVDVEEATGKMLTELLDSTGDPYAQYYDSKRFEEYIKENADRKISGVGVLFGDYNGRAYVIDVLEGSEAQAEGVSQGDFVEAIDGDSEHAWSASEVIGALSREDDSKVVITWMRPISLDASSGEEFTTTLTVQDYDVENVIFDLRDNEVGYIKLSQFTGNSKDLVNEAFENLESRGAKCYVLDIRDNPGGYLTQALDIASLFIPSGVLVGIETTDGTTTRTASGATISNAPMVVLVNSYTSGVAEVLTAALKDNQRAEVVGQRTMGKGSVQVTRELSFGGAVRYTAAYYISPNGQAINGVGVAPSVDVSNRDGSEFDLQLTVAIDTARSQVKQ